MGLTKIVGLLMNLDVPAASSPDQSTDPIIRTIIADDERLAREKLRILLASEANVKLVAECSDGKKTVSAIRAHGADLLLLDIQMPGMDGFQVLNELSPEEMPVVIFTSAYDQYAIRAFEAHALDYLLKPFDRHRKSPGGTEQITRSPDHGSHPQFALPGQVRNAPDTSYRRSPGNPGKGSHCVPKSVRD